MENKENRPLEEQQAVLYLTERSFLSGIQPDTDKLLFAAVGLAADFCMLSDDRGSAAHVLSEAFTQAVYEDRHDMAYRLVMQLYKALDEPVPKHIRALAGIEDLWARFSSLVKEEIDILAECFDKEDDSLGDELELIFELRGITI